MTENYSSFLVHTLFDKVNELLEQIMDVPGKGLLTSRFLSSTFPLPSFQKSPYPPLNILLNSNSFASDPLAHEGHFRLTRTIGV